MLPFILVELLIAIAVIAIMTSLFLPALSKARERVKQIQCASNLKQTASAIFSYANDFAVFSIRIIRFDWKITFIQHISFYPAAFQVFHTNPPPNFLFARDFFVQYLYLRQKRISFLCLKQLIKHEDLNNGPYNDISRISLFPSAVTLFPVPVRMQHSAAGRIPSRLLF